MAYLVKLRSIDLSIFLSIRLLELPRFDGHIGAWVSECQSMSSFVLNWRKIANRRVPTMRIVPTFNECKYGLASFLDGMEYIAVEQLAFQRGEETLAHGVVVAVADRTH